LMANRKLKKIMTDLAAGHITKQEADRLIKPKKTPQKRPVQEFEGKDKGHSKKQSENGVHSKKQSKIHTELNAKKEVKKSHKHT